MQILVQQNKGEAINPNKLPGMLIPLLHGVART